MVSFLTDVEGDRDYFNRFVQQSRILKFTSSPNNKMMISSNNDSSLSSSSLSFDFPYDEWVDFVESTEKDEDTTTTMLVYGGDVWDQGGFDLYVIRQLLALKLRYPTRVFFCLGNRDLNKMRMTQELGPLKSTQAPYHPGIYWSLRTTTRTSASAPTEISTNPVERLRWMLQKTMGSPKAFQHRKQELQSLTTTTTTTTKAEITDWDVVESYRQSVRCEMALFLSHGYLALKLGPVLFLHGALPLTDQVLFQSSSSSSSSQQQPQQNNKTRNSTVWNDFTKFMPWLEEDKKDHNDETKVPTTTVSNTMDWIQQLNQFCHDNVNQWIRHYQQQQNTTPNNNDNATIWSCAGGYHNTSAPSYGKLMQYGMGWTPDGIRNPTVVYNSWSESGIPPSRFVNNDNNNNDDMYVRAIREFCQQTTGLRVICSGHQPQGDIPNFIRVTLDDEDDDNTLSSSSSSSSSSKHRLAWIVAADTSYSGNVIMEEYDKEDGGSFNQMAQATTTQQQQPPPPPNGSNGRGPRAVSEVLIEWEEGNLDDPPVVYCHGTLNDGTMYETLPLPMTSNDNNNTKLGVVVGQLAKPKNQPNDDNDDRLWWTKAVFVDGSILQSTAKDYKFWNRIIWR